MIFKKIVWIFKRHPFLYLTRFRLLSKNSNVEEIKNLTYNIINTKGDIPDYFFEINNDIFKNGKPQTDLEVVKELCCWLVNNIKGGPGLSVPSEKALRIMLLGKGGVCSDMVQIFNNFCVINDIQVKEWGVTRAPFNRDYGGHSFNEVYCKELKKWVLVDVSYCALFFHDKINEPLSVVEFYQFLRQNKEQLSFEIFNQSMNVDEQAVTKNYLCPDNIPFLIHNYSNKTYDWFLERFRPHLPIFIIHFFIFIIGKSYNYKFPLDDYKNIFMN